MEANSALDDIRKLEEKDENQQDRLEGLEFGEAISAFHGLGK